MPEKKTLSFSYIFAWTSVSPDLSPTKAYHLALSHTYCRRDVTIVTANNDEKCLTDHWFSFFRTTAGLLINYNAFMTVCLMQNSRPSNICFKS
jgi:hypothetical protein